MMNEKQPSWGGARSGAGRKRNPDKKIQLMTMVSRKTRDFLKKEAEERGMSLSSLAAEKIEAQISAEQNDGQKQRSL